MGAPVLHSRLRFIVKEKGETVTVLAVSDTKAEAKWGSVCVGGDLGKRKGASLGTEHQVGG